MSSTAEPIVLPGQPLPSKFNSPPTPQPGQGCYLRQGKLVASIVGVPVRDGSVGEGSCSPQTEDRGVWLADRFGCSFKVVNVKSRNETSAVPEIGSIVSQMVPFRTFSMSVLIQISSDYPPIGCWNSKSPSFPSSSPNAQLTP